jgi:hypothetical protein
MNWVFFPPYTDSKRVAERATVKARSVLPSSRTAFWAAPIHTADGFSVLLPASHRSKSESVRSSFLPATRRLHIPVKRGANRVVQGLAHPLEPAITLAGTASGSVAAHFLTCNPTRGECLDYTICCQCGFVLGRLIDRVLMSSDKAVFALPCVLFHVRRLRTDRLPDGMAHEQGSEAPVSSLVSRTIFIKCSVVAQAPAHPI